MSSTEDHNLRSATVPLGVPNWRSVEEVAPHHLRYRRPIVASLPTCDGASCSGWSVKFGSIGDSPLVPRPDHQIGTAMSRNACATPPNRLFSRRALAAGRIRRSCAPAFTHLDVGSPCAGRVPLPGATMTCGVCAAGRLAQRMDRIATDAPALRLIAPWRSLRPPSIGSLHRRACPGSIGLSPKRSSAARSRRTGGRYALIGAAPRRLVATP